MLDFELEEVNRTLCCIEHSLGLSERPLALLVKFFASLALIVRIRLFDSLRHRQCLFVLRVGCVDFRFDLRFFSLEIRERLGVRIESVLNVLGALL